MEAEVSTLEIPAGDSLDSVERIRHRINEPEETTEFNGVEDLKEFTVNAPVRRAALRTQPKSITGLAEYNVYVGPACCDPRSSTQKEIAEDLNRIISCEGPVQVKRAFDIYLRSCGIKRMGYELEAQLDKALDSLKRTEKILSRKYNFDHDNLRDIVWMVGRPSEVIRERGDRRLDEIPLGELSGISRMVEGAFGLKPGSEEHLRRILDALDLQRLTSNAESTLKEAIGWKQVESLKWNDLAQRVPLKTGTVHNHEEEGYEETKLIDSNGDLNLKALKDKANSLNFIFEDRRANNGGLWILYVSPSLIFDGQFVAHHESKFIIFNNEISKVGFEWSDLRKGWYLK